MPHIRLFVILSLICCIFTPTRSATPATLSDEAASASIKQGAASAPISDGTASASIKLGDDQPECYLPLLQGKRVALYTNHTGLDSQGRHILDVLIAHNVNVKAVFAPEHGFRGSADAGEHVGHSTDPATGVAIVSLYGPRHKQAMQQTLDSIDVIVNDIQDVGLRFYTYYATMLELMDAAAQRSLLFVVLDRPNPNGMYVDGPILDMKFASGVGRLPIPVVHGLTLGEMMSMANGEGWLPSQKKAKLRIIPCKGYAHDTRYQLPVPPSPNLPNMKAIYLYPSLCYFEATPISLGRGTEKPFQIYGHPSMKNRTFHFKPVSRPGAKNPPQIGKLCHGVDLSDLDDDSIIAKGIDLTYLIDAYQDLKQSGMTDKFFTRFFENLIGNDNIRQMIINGKSADEIKATWQADVLAFEQKRAAYLLYPLSSNR